MNYRFLALLLVVSPVFAHLSSGVDLYKSGYHIDFGYAPLHPVAGSQTIMAFVLENQTDGSVVFFDNVWVIVSLGNETALSAQIAQDNGDSSFAMSFPRAGNYSVAFRFYNGYNGLVSATVPLVVEPKLSDNSDFVALLVAVGLAFVSLSYFFRKK